MGDRLLYIHNSLNLCKPLLLQTLWSCSVFKASDWNTRLEFKVPKDPGYVIHD